MMGNSDSVNIYFLIFLCVHGLVWTQYMSCPAKDWTLDSTITLRCYLPRVDYPDKCTFSFTDQVVFKREPFTGSSSTRCTVNAVSTTSCTSSSSECGCDPANATYFIVHHAFTVDSDDDGTWKCPVDCLDDFLIPQLTFTQDNCEDREVVAHAVLSTPTITVTTPATGSGWTVRGTVDITRIFSSTGQYSCLWIYKLDSGVYTYISSPSISFDSPVSGTSVRTGRCDLPDTLLYPNPGTHTYSVRVSPGHTVKTDSSVIIETPAIPSISCNPNTGYVSEDGEVRCTCNGNVGQPGGRLRWFMESDTGNTPIKDGQYGDATLTVTQTVNRNHHGNKLRCDVDWITDITGPDFTLQVAYPPSSPVISRTNGQSDPPLEGDTVTLTCSLTSSGHPSARITWPSEGSSVNTNPLQLTVDEGDNLRNVTCQASNEFTQHKGIQLRDDFLLQIYYGPDITLRPAGDNDCDMTSDTTSCHVTEGQRIHLLCDVDSNPDPTQCTWSVFSGSDIDLDTRPDLDIVSVSRTHSGVYQVKVETDKPDSGDDRLPLKAHIDLTVLVKYPPTETKLTVNNKVSVTVNETEAVTLECESRGRPTPRLELRDDHSVWANEVGGQLSLSEEWSGLSHSMTAGCQATGTVTCRADNKVGSDQHTSVQLYVNCKPRSRASEPDISIAYIIDQSVSVSFHLEAFPLPDRHRFQYLGRSQSSDTSQPVPDNIVLTATCANTYAEYAVSCIVYMNGARDATAEGFYVYTAANDFGEERFVFHVTLKASSGPPVVVVVGVALGTVLAVVMIVILVFVCCKWRPRWIMPCAGESRGQSNGDSRPRKEESRERPLPVSPVSEEYELTEEETPRLDRAHQPSSVYTSLETSDIGVPSVYSEISSFSHTAASVPQDPLYENSGAKDRPVYLNTSA